MAQNKWLTMHLIDDHDQDSLSGKKEREEMLVGVQIYGGSLRPVCFGEPNYDGPLSINLVNDGHLTRYSVDVFNDGQLASLKTAGKLEVPGNNGWPKYYRLIEA